MTGERTYRELTYTQAANLGYDHQFLAYIFHELIGVRQGTILDLGCGRGDQMKVMRDLGFETIGIDGEPGPHIAHAVDFGENPLPLADNSVDMVFSKSVIEHLYLPQIKRYMREIMRVLKPGGHVVILTPDWIYCWDDYYDGFTHVTPFTCKSLRTCMGIYGFADVRTHLITPLPQCWRSPFWALLADITNKLPLSKKWGKWIRWSKERQTLGIARKPAVIASPAAQG